MTPAVFLDSQHGYVCTAQVKKMCAFGTLPQTRIPLHQSCACRTLPMLICRSQIAGFGRLPEWSQMRLTKLCKPKRPFKVQFQGLLEHPTNPATTKEIHFQFPPEKREGMSDGACFVTFWTGIVTDKSLSLPPRLLAVVIVPLRVMRSMMQSVYWIGL